MLGGGGVTPRWTTILDKINGKPRPPSPPNQGWENGTFWLLRDFILDLGGWVFAVPFYFVQDCSMPPGEGGGGVEIFLVA